MENEFVVSQYGRHKIIPSSTLTVTPTVRNNERVAINAIKIGFIGSEEVLVTVDDEGRVAVMFTMDLDRTPIRLSNSGSSTWGIAMHAKTQLLAVSANSFRITLFDLGHHNNVGSPLGYVWRRELVGHGHNIPAIDFSSDGTLIGSCSIGSNLRHMPHLERTNWRFDVCATAARRSKMRESTGADSIAPIRNKAEKYLVNDVNYEDGASEFSSSEEDDMAVPSPGSEDFFPSSDSVPEPVVVASRIETDRVIGDILPRPVVDSTPRIEPEQAINCTSPFSAPQATENISGQMAAFTSSIEDGMDFADDESSSDYDSAVDDVEQIQSENQQVEVDTREVETHELEINFEEQVTEEEMEDRIADIDHGDEQVEDEQNEIEEHDEEMDFGDEQVEALNDIEEDGDQGDQANDELWETDQEEEEDEDEERSDTMSEEYDEDDIFTTDVWASNPNEGRPNGEVKIAFPAEFNELIIYTTEHDVYLYDPTTLKTLSHLSNIFAGMEFRGHLKNFDRLCFAEVIPEYELIVVASQAGAAALIRLVKNSSSMEGYDMVNIPIFIDKVLIKIV
ncbi:hypothetical protein HDU76_004127 [Blyttiomyces sp. JEL0837]|nr:hypothetical protein HDU76_004127 [Blyttiomyces sp. JEL0837]